MLKKTFASITLGVLGALVLAAGVFFVWRLYTAPLEHRLLTQTRNLQDLARDLRDGAQDIDQGNISALAALRRDDARIETLMDRWRAGDAGAWRPAAWVIPVERIRRLTAQWKVTHQQVTELLGREQVLKGIGRAIAMLDQTATSLLSQSEKIVGDLVEGGGDDRDVYFASRQIVLIQRISQHLHTLLKPTAWSGAFTESPGYKDLVSDAALFEHTLEALLKGDRRLGVSRARDAGVQQRLRDNGKMFVAINRDIGQILAMVPVLQDIRHTMRSLHASSREFARDGDGLADALVTYRARYDTLFAAAYLTGAAALVMLFAYGVYDRRRFQGRLDFSLAQNKRFKQALSDLQPVLAGLAKGEVSAGELETGAGVEGVIVPFNQAMAQWRNTLIAIKGWTAKLTPLVEQVNAAAARVAQDTGRQVEGTTASSASLNRALPTVDQAAGRIAEISAALETLKAGGATARRRVQEATVQELRGDGAQPIDALVGELDSLARGVEELSVMVLHLLVRIQDAGQAGHEPVSYANRALQVAHQCTEAVERLDEGLTQLREGDSRRAVDEARPDQLPARYESFMRQMDEHFAAMDNQSERIAGLLRETAPLLGELTAALLSMSDDLDNIHEYTMHASNETADALKSGKRIAELVDHIGRSIDKYNIMQ